MSSIGWVDFSEKDRQRTLGVLRLLDEPGTLDALGIGRIRDAFSDLLFPGTSTIQTRARYFLIVPWLYRDLELRSPRQRPEAEAAKKERGLIERFNAARESGGGDLEGLIGSQAGAAIRQLPSAIYWQGLHAWGIRRKAGPRRVFLREVRLGRIDRTPRPEEEMTSIFTSWWDRGLPPKPDDLLEKPTLELTPEEAAYLQEAIAVNQPESLLAHLARQDEPLPRTGLVWNLPAGHISDLPARLEKNLGHARRFSLLVHGAHILYYLMLAEMRTDGAEELEHHRQAIDNWRKEIESRRSELIEWFGDESSRCRFWMAAKQSNPRIPGPLEKRFVETWFDLTIDPSNGQIDSSEARALLTQRELALKGSHRARLSNAGAREYWTGSDQVGPLDFRWGTVQRHLADIHTGLAATTEPVHA